MSVTVLDLALHYQTNGGGVVETAQVLIEEDMTMADILEALAQGGIDTLDSESDTNTFDSEWYPEDDWEDWYREDDSLYEYDNHI